MAIQIYTGNNCYNVKVILYFNHKIQAYKEEPEAKASNAMRFLEYNQSVLFVYE